jgi:hypothetical protein
MNLMDRNNSHPFPNDQKAGAMSSLESGIQVAGQVLTSLP